MAKSQFTNLLTQVTFLNVSTVAHMLAPQVRLKTALPIVDSSGDYA